MPLRVAVQMDPLRAIRVRGDTSFALMLEAQRRKHKIFAYHPNSLALIAGGKLTAYGDWVVPHDVGDKPGDKGEGKHFTIDKSEWVNLAEVDVVLMRQDPPFDMHYITATHLLETIADKTLVVNDPRGVRNAPEKIVVATRFAHLLPPTLISRDPRAIAEFRATHGAIIIKPLYGSGGAGVFLLKEGDGNVTSVVETLLAVDRSPLMIQRYLAEIKHGDKRIIMLDGKPIAALNRLPAKGEVRANLHVGGQEAHAELDEADLRITAAIGDFLVDEGLLLCGIDVIGGYLTEINNTSPTGLREIKALTKIDHTKQIWDVIEAKIK